MADGRVRKMVSAETNATSPFEDVAGVQFRAGVFTNVTTPRTGSAVQMWRVRRSDSMLSNAICLPSGEILMLEP